MNNFIAISNASTNNLKNISLNIPKHKIVAVTGVSGSGKSSLVFDTIASESQRLLSETYSSYIQELLPKYKKPVVDSITNLPVSLVINQKRIHGNSRSTVGTITDIYSNLRLLFSRIAKPFIGYSMKYSFNNPEGMCQHCKGLGEVKSIDIKQLLDFDKSLNEGAIRFPTFQDNGWRLSRYTESGFFDNDKLLSEYTKNELELLLHSPKIKPVNPTNKWHKSAEYLGVIPRIMTSFVYTDSSKYQKDLTRILVLATCPNCSGTRLNDEVLQAKIAGKSIADCCRFSIVDLLDFINQINNSEVKIILDELKLKLKGLCTVGLGYLTLNRATNTLSGGESQRIKITKYLNSALSDVLYIFDEPSVGLHPEDLKGINQILIALREKGNSILFVDHDPAMIMIADEIINFGEGSGVAGGKVTFQGSIEKLLRSDTLTGRALRKKHRINTVKIPFSDYYELNNASKNNIRNISIKVPVNALTLVTGVAGSGKSTLIRQLFKSQYPQSIIVDQNLPHMSNRSNLMTYLGIFNEIKKIFSKANAVTAKLFSPTGMGACIECKGKGFIKLDLAYLGDTEHICEKCQGKKYNNQALAYFYKGKNISEVAGLTAQEALGLFDDSQIIQKALKSIIKANLSYIKLGQTLDTFSGGELQRLKIAQMLMKASTGIIILDEPSTGLHETDIDKLLCLFHQLISEGNTLIVLEHNLSVISEADWLIDLGPEGGDFGGQLLFEGYPADFINCKKSHTANHLKKFLDN